MKLKRVARRSGTIAMQIVALCFSGYAADISQMSAHSAKIGEVMVHGASGLDVSPLLAVLNASKSAAQQAVCKADACGISLVDSDLEQEENSSVPTAAPKPVITQAGAAVEQRSQGKKSPVPMIENFEGLGAGFEGPNGTAKFRNPSDNSLAVGPNHVVQIVNSRIAVYTKKGARYEKSGKVLYGPIATNTLWAGFGGVCEARNNGDGVVRYDQLAGRWLFVMPIFTRINPGDFPAGHGNAAHAGEASDPGPAATLPANPPPPPVAGKHISSGSEAETKPHGTFAMCYAISVSDDPLGAYYRYAFERTLFPDYPRPAVWPDGYYVATSTGDEVIQKHVCIVDRAKMLQGKPATEQCIVLDGVSFLNNADIDGYKLPPSGAPNVMMAAGGTQLKNIFDDDVIYAWRVHVDWKTPANTNLSGPEKIRVAPYHFLCNGQLTNCVTQPGTNLRLDAQGDKLMQRLVYRKIGKHESIVAAHSVGTQAGGGGVRWYEFRLDKQRNPYLYQQGTYAPDEFYRWMPSIAMDKKGDIGIGYSFGGTPNFAGQRFAARSVKDPKGMLSLRETVLVNGEASQTNTFRWEDYVTTATDPSDGCTFWYVGDYLKKGETAHYSSKIGSFRLPGCKGK